MEGAFGIVLFVVVGLAVVVAALTLVGRSGLYEQIGRGGLSLRDEEPAPVGAPALAVRDQEIREMLAASNERRIARGEAPLDIEAELRRLTAPAADPSIEAEVRELVVARNERLVERGEPPLDVETEVARRLRELGA